MKMTTDIWFTSFLIEFRGYKLLKSQCTSRGRGKFFFDITTKQWEEEKREFFNSDLSKIKHCQERLKDLFF